MSKKTIVSLGSLLVFIMIALASGTPQSLSNSSSSSYGRSSSSSSSSTLQKTDFPKTAQKCPSCYGAGCARCNNSGVILR